MFQFITLSHQSFVVGATVEKILHFKLKADKIPMIYCH